MNFEWDSRKNEANIKKHGIGFQEAKKVFEDPLHLSIEDHDHSQDEERWVTVGWCKDSLMVVVCHTFRIIGQEETVRLISARKATPRETRQYYGR